MKSSARLLSLCCLLLLAAPARATVAEFEKFSADFLNGYLAWRPQQGVALGLHEYDGKLTDYSTASVAKERERLSNALAQLAKIDPTGFKPKPLHDYRLLRAAIQNELFTFEELDAYRRNPITYAGVFDLTIYIKRNFAPMEERLGSIIQIERQAPAVFAAARANLGARLPKPFVETAIEVAAGGADFLAKDLVEALKTFPDSKLKNAFQEANATAIAELKGYVAYLKEQKLPAAEKEFAMGREKYVKMLRVGELIPVTPEQILETGMKELRREQALFAETARLIDPTRKPIEVFKAIQRDHPTADKLISDTADRLEGIRRFVKEKKLVTIPSEARARVEETPAFARATSFASMDTPGPFEKKATEAFYYITPVEPEWPAAQKEEWLTAFNYYTTDVVSIHEAYPGHYVQFLSLNASKANRLEKIFGSYAFTEGWAHYTEQMLVDEGFGKSAGAAAGPDLKQAKYRLAQLDEALLRLCRLCVSIRMHCQGMSLEEGTKFFEENCYYEHKPAYQEAIRGTFDPGYLYYTLGKLQILKLRDDLKNEWGARFTMQKFHDELLRHGMPPIRLLRELLLKDPSSWDQIL